LFEAVVIDVSYVVGSRSC